MRLRRGGVVIGSRVAVGGRAYGPRGRSCCPPHPRASAEPEREPLPAFGFGAYAGGAELDREVGAGELGLLARYRLTESLALEGELSRALTEGGERADRLLGGALVYDTLPRRTFSPYFLFGVGATHARASGGAEEAGYAYGEVGAGLALNLSENLSLMGDLRAGGRRAPEEAVNGPSLSEQEDYTRARVAALLYF